MAAPEIADKTMICLIQFPATSRLGLTIDTILHGSCFLRKAPDYIGQQEGNGNGVLSPPNVMDEDNIHDRKGQGL